MIAFQDISLETFLSDYWQKKPLVIRHALPHFQNPLSPDELAGLALEEDIESRLVQESPHQSPQWHLQRGPFQEQDFSTLPATHWTLLVQGVEKLVPEVYALLNNFDFIPQWRLDDVMISFATLFGSVGPHYDNYDVFLYQAQGRREWALTTKNCTPDNHEEGLELRIMKTFQTEQRFILEEGDMLYLPPHVGHHGVSLSEECMTYSFGYRSYSGQEMLDSLSEYVAENELFNQLYQDPDWSSLKQTSAIEAPAWKNAQALFLQLIQKDALMQSWFAAFSTRLDEAAEQHLSLPIEEEVTTVDFISELHEGQGLVRDACCRFAYIESTQQLFINGIEWDTHHINPALPALLANNRFISLDQVKPFLQQPADLNLLFELWKLQWLQNLPD